MIDLASRYLEIVKKILAEHVPRDEVRVFGSRVKGTAKRYADLDLVVVGRSRLERNRLCQLEEALAESDLPFRVDVLDWFTLSEDFRKEIEARFEVIQEPDRVIAQTNLPFAPHER